MGAAGEGEALTEAGMIEMVTLSHALRLLVGHAGERRTHGQLRPAVRAAEAVDILGVRRRCAGEREQNEHCGEMARQGGELRHNAGQPSTPRRTGKFAADRLNAN